MRIAYIAEDVNHDCLIKALSNKLCGDRVELLRGRYEGRGKPGILRAIKGKKRGTHKRDSVLNLLLNRDAVTFVIVLVDSDNGFQETYDQFSKAVLPQFLHKVVICVARRNVECWFLSDPKCNKSRFGIDKLEDLKSAKKIFKDGMGITARNRKKDDVTQFILEAPLKEWYKHSPSFKKSYDSIRAFTGNVNCEIPVVYELD